MAYLAVVGSKAVNGVAYIHSEIIKETIFKVHCSAALLYGHLCRVLCTDVVILLSAKQQSEGLSQIDAYCAIALYFCNVLFEMAHLCLCYEEAD